MGVVNVADEAPPGAPDVSADPALAGLGLTDKVVRYEEFLEKVLKPRLEAVLKKRDDAYEDMAEGVKLKNFVETELIPRVAAADAARKAEMPPEPMETMVDLGHHFYATAHMEDPNAILVNVGMGVYVRYSAAEALAYLTKREALIEQRCQQLTDQASRVKVEMKVVYEAIAEQAAAGQ